MKNISIGPIEGLGTEWLIELLAENTDQSLLESDTRHYLSDFEERYSRFIDDSLISTLNATGRLVNPSEETLQLFELARQGYEATNGVFNILSGELAEQSGYDKSYSFIGREHPSTIAPPFEQALEISTSHILLKAGSVDLGGCGKGFAIDGLASLYKRRGIKDFIINGGGDIRVGGSAKEVILQYPQWKNFGIGKVALNEQSLAASSPFERSWFDRVTGRSKNHLRTTESVSSFVVAESAGVADVWATALAVAPDLVTPPEVSVLLLKDQKIMWADTMFQLYS